MALNKYSATLSFAGVQKQVWLLISQRHVSQHLGKESNGPGSYGPGRLRFALRYMTSQWQQQDWNPSPALSSTLTHLWEAGYCTLEMSTS